MKTIENSSLITSGNVLRIPAGTLISDKEYKVECKGASGSISGNATGTFSTDLNPASIQFSVSPSSGRGYSTEFTLNVGVSKNMKCEIGFIMGVESQYRMPLYESESYSLDTITMTAKLPQGYFATNELPLYAECLDAYNVTSTVLLNVTVSEALYDGAIESELISLFQSTSNMTKL